ncbi:MAG: class I SAM-dependent rRNA methyltransferase, partial [Candidatus Aureabacteria bacterium]|nr:class I SAM-dependent rRNA methyltransferase [Candidatus Auribacterota bacterium]
MKSIYLKKSKDKNIRMGHPWIFSGAIQQIPGQLEPGELCRIFAHEGNPLGIGYYHPVSSIAVRMLCLGTNDSFTETDIHDRIKKALDQRKPWLNTDTNACRLINSEGDFLPGLVVDRYSEGLCIQITTAGMNRFRESILSSLNSILSPEFIYEKSDSELMSRENLPFKKGILSGLLPVPLIIKENGLRFMVDLEEGQKSGFFLDQKWNRSLVREYARDRKVCDCFCYTGGFSVYALAGKARNVHLVDSSKKALHHAMKNMELNGHTGSGIHYEEQDVFQYLREATPCPYDLIILDPPKFAKKAADKDKAARGYKDINLLAMKKIQPGGVLFTFSCSQAVDTTLFRQILYSAAAESNRQVQVLHVLSQPPDHP